MTKFDEQGRPEPPAQGDEAATLLGFLEWQRATFEWKCSGLDAAGLRTSLPVSTMTLGGMLKHLAYVESSWFNDRLSGRPPVPPWDTPDWDAQPDWDWESAADHSPQELFALWHESVAMSRALVEEALAHGDLGQPAQWAFRDGDVPSLRWIITHMIEEYARHNGHADLLRQSIDGQVGE